MLHIEVILRQISNGSQTLPTIVATLLTSPESTKNDGIQNTTSEDQSLLEYTGKIEGKKVVLSSAEESDQVVYCKGM